MKMYANTNNQASHPTIGKSFLGRVSAVALPAAIITGALFLGMRAIIQVDDFTPPKDKSVILEAYYVSEVETEYTETKREILPPPEAQTPPPIEKLKSLVTNPKLPIVEIGGAAPAEYVIEKIEPIKVGSTMAVLDKQANPITTPMPVYPRKALERGLEGDCEVHLNVSPTGEPYSVSANCSDSVFEKAAERAVRKVMFSPLVRDGKRVELLGAVYPIVFRFQE